MRVNAFCSPNNCFLYQFSQSVAAKPLSLNNRSMKPGLTTTFGFGWEDIGHYTMLSIGLIIITGGLFAIVRDIRESRIQNEITNMLIKRAKDAGEDPV